MRARLLPLATTLVRAWTRFYTHGLPQAERSARRAEIDSHLWEFEHDPEAPKGIRGAAHVLAQLFAGVPDDIAWRIDVGAAPHGASIRTLAAAGVMTGPRRVSAFGLAATIHIVAISAVMWLASRGPVVSPDAGGGAAGYARMGRRVSPRGSPWSQIAEYQRSAMPVGKMQSVTPAPKRRRFDVLSAKAGAMAARLGLIGPPSGAAQLSAIGPLVQHTHASTTSDRFVAQLLQNRYSLSVRNGHLAGSGANVLQAAIVQSQFVLLGEEHGLTQTPEFGTAVCNAAGPERFQTMAIEQGPLAAAELENLAGRRDGLAQLAAFEKQFPRSLGVSREEFEMLQECARAAHGEFHMWGVSQEAPGAAGLILSRVLASRISGEARTAIQRLLQKNDEADRTAVQSGRLFDLFMIAADDNELARVTALLQKSGSREAQSLFWSLVESHEINRTSPADYGNARRRERLMKTLFAANYARAATGALPPKVLLKFGGYHVYRGLNPVHGSGIGNYVAEFAEAQGAQSLLIRLVPVKGSAPIFPRVGQPAQLRPFNHEDEPGYRYLQTLFSNRLPADWTMFDLRPLRHDFNALVGAANPDLATLVFGVDILVMVPEGTPSSEIR